ncbi:MAG: hypothetical protein U5N26_06185 [Candidatus Marinimicrobia bacterium]|nr:hypothetical protein [Candidatus Neomarinimicrobiota bacterium]
MYWHVKAVRKARRRYTFALHFSGLSGSTAGTRRPMRFRLETPPQESILDTLRPHFAWEACAAIPDPSGQPVLAICIWGRHTDSMECVYRGGRNAYTAGETLKENGRYRWYVTAVDRAGAATFSKDVRKFAVNTVNEMPPAPVPLSPRHNSYQTTRSRTFPGRPSKIPIRATR